ncbi:hypothetical protein, partial [Sinorhizobium meliloti]|uniref:hypothetical protein n=1 Tax=Rhizobium meliloti TaxID=382 RepID=UPI001AEC908A
SSPAQRLRISIAARVHQLAISNLSMSGLLGATPQLDLTLSDHEFGLRRGCFMDQYGNGFIVYPNRLEPHLNGRSLGGLVGNVSGNNLGSWGLNNSNNFPGHLCPGGFADFREI